MKSKIIIFFLCIMLALSLSLHCVAADITNEREYKPLDLVVVMDASGSMMDSDSNRTVPDAVRMLVNMMPAEDSRVGIISFNRQPNVLTTDAKGSAALIALKEFTGVETIREGVSSVQYSGATGIGNALFAATELLKNKSDANHSKAIILFTDGINDFGNNQLALSECDANEVSAIKWAKANNCVVYCVGYDYIENGVSSMGTNGEGLQKLQSISNNTGGKFKVIHNITEIEQLLIEFLADICDLNYKTIVTIPGDGKYHQCEISVNPSVVEANIRIAGGDVNAIANGDVRLYDPSGTEIQLRNSGNVRFDNDAKAASIKIIMPKAGEWLLTVSGIEGEDIHVGLLEHYKMNLTSQLSFPDGNPEGVAYTNDEIGIRTWLTYDGEDLDEDAVYDSVTSAVAVCTSRANPDDKKTITLTRDGRSFIGSFTIPEDSFYDIYIRLDWDTVYREDTLTVASNNKPLYLVKDIESVKVTKNKTAEIKDLFQYVADDENDAITATVLSCSDPDVVDVDLQDSSLMITGKKWSSTLITIEFKDAQGNTVSTSFDVKVIDVTAIIILVLLGIGLIIVVIAIISALKKLTDRTSGKMKIMLLSKGIITSSGEFKDTEVVYINPNIKDQSQVVIENSESVNEHDSYNSNNGSGNAFGFSDASSSGLFGGNAFENSAGSVFGDFGSDAFGAFGNGFDIAGDVFGNPQEKSDDTELNKNFDTVGDSFFGVQVNHDPFAEEKAISDRFDEEIDLFGGRSRKKNLSFVIDRFLELYSEHMNHPDKESRLFQQVKTFVDGFKAVFSSVQLLGTAMNGASGIIFAPSKKLIPKRMVVHSPKLSKKRTVLNPNKRTIILSISLPQGGKDENGNVAALHIEIQYYK